MTFNKLVIWSYAENQYSRFSVEPLDSSCLWNSTSDKKFTESFMLVAQVSSCDKWEIYVFLLNQNGSCVELNA